MLYRFVLILVLLAISVESSNLYAWGVNDYGQLGINGSTVFRLPQLIPTYIDLDIVDLKASGTFHMAVAANGDVHVCGNNWYGGLGLPIANTEFVATPRKNEALKDCKIYLGKRHGNAVCGNRFLGWGVQSGYVIGRKTGNYGMVNESLASYGLGSNVANVTAGNHFSIVTRTDGSMIIAGTGGGGILGLGDTQPRNNFVEFDAFKDIPLLKIFPSHADHICAISESYSLYCWGSNTVGQLGLGNTINQTRPQLVSFFENEHYVVSVATGLYHTLALTASGKVFAWGLGAHGVLGNKVSDNSTFATPIEIEFLSDKNVVEIVAGLNFNFVRTSENKWFSWGAGYGGVLGTKTDEDVNTPTQVDFLATFQINRILTASTSRSLYGWLDPSAPTEIVTKPPLVNECELEGVIECGANERCQDTDRFAKCVCLPGYSGPIGSCVDINECLIAHAVCAPNATCTNLPGSYNCTCPPDRPIGDGKSSGTRCSPAPTEPPTQPPTEPPTEPPTAAPTQTPATTASSSNNTTGVSGVPTTGATTDGSNVTTTAQDSTTNQQGTTSGQIDTTTGTDTNPATTSNGPSTSTGDASTNGQTNLYQTLYGAKEQIEKPASEVEDDPEVIFTGGRNRDRDVMIGVLIAFGALMLVVIVIGALLILRARRPARD